MATATLPLIGREDSLAAMAKAWEATIGHGSGAALVVGDPGIGKSAILEAFEGLLLSRNARVIRMQAPFGRSGSFGLLGAALTALSPPLRSTTLGIERTIDQLVSSSPEEQQTFERALLGHLFGLQGVPLVDPSHARPRAIALACRMVVDLVGSQPTAFLIDDLHRADNESRAWLRAFVQCLESSPGAAILLAATLPSGRAELLADCLGSEIRIIRLEALEEADRLSLARVLAPDLDPETLTTIASLGAGHPAFMATLARLSAPFPATWREATMSEFSALSPESRAAIDSLAILGSPSSDADLAAVAGSRLASSALDSVRSLVRGPFGIWFREANTCDFALDAMAARTRKALHGRAGKLLEARNPAEAADHYERAGMQPELRRALREAARAAIRAYALDEARAHLERALSSPVSGPPPGDLVLALADLDITLGKYQEALGLVAKHQASLGDSQRAEGLWTMGRALERMGQYSAGLAHLTEGLGLLKANDSAARTRIITEIATLDLRGGRNDTALSRALAILAEPRISEGESTRGMAHSIAGICLYRRGELDEASWHHSRALEIREVARDVPAIANTLNNIGNVNADAGRWQEAMAAYRRSLALIELGGEARTGTAVLNNIAALCLAMGDDDQAEIACRRSLAGKAQTGETAGVGIAMATLAAIQSRKGDRTRGLATIREAIAILEAGNSGEILAEAYASQGDMLVESGDPGAAWPVLRRALILAREAKKPGVSAKVLRAFSRLYAGKGLRETALRFATEAVAECRKVNRPLELARCLETLSLAEGDAQGAAASEARSLFGRLRGPASAN